MLSSLRERRTDFCHTEKLASIASNVFADLLPTSLCGQAAIYMLYSTLWFVLVYAPATMIVASIKLAHEMANLIGHGGRYALRGGADRRSTADEDTKRHAASVAPSRVPCRSLIPKAQYVLVV